MSLCFVKFADVCRGCVYDFDEFGVGVAMGCFDFGFGHAYVGGFHGNAVVFFGVREEGAIPLFSYGADDFSHGCFLFGGEIRGAREYGVEFGGCTLTVVFDDFDHFIASRLISTHPDKSASNLGSSSSAL